LYIELLHPASPSNALLLALEREPNRNVVEGKGQESAERHVDAAEHKWDSNEPRFDFFQAMRIAIFQVSKFG
jgi:hypothetical protein